MLVETRASPCSPSRWAELLSLMLPCSAVAGAGSWPAGRVKERGLRYIPDGL